MAETPNAGGYQAPVAAPKQKPKQSPLAPATPAASILPAKPPMSPLLNLGMTQSIDQVNKHVADVTTAHKNLFGTSPSPGLIFDVIRGASQGIVKDVNHLFDIPPSKLAARVKAATVITPITPIHDVVDENVQKQVDALPAKALKQLQGEGLDPYKLYSLSGDQREQYVAETIRNRIADRRDKIIAQQANLGSEFTVVGRAVSQISNSIKDIPQGVAKLAVASGKDVYDLSRWPGYLIQKPFGSVEKKVGLSAPPKPGTPLRTEHLLKLAGESTIQDFEHPRERIGYLLMDIAAALSIGAGAAARTATAAGRVAEISDQISAASRYGNSAAYLEGLANDAEAANPYGRSIVFKDAHVKAQAAQVRDLRDAAQHLRDSEAANIPADEAMRKLPSHVRDALGQPLGVSLAVKKVSTFAKTIIQKPYHEPIKVGFGSYNAYVPAFDNEILYAIQKKIVANFNSKMLRNHSPETELAVARRSKVYDALFSPERWTKRTMDNNQLIDMGIEMHPGHELTRLTTWRARAEAMREAIAEDPHLARSWKTVGNNNRLALGKLITMVFTEDPNPVNIWRNFHENAIADAQKEIDSLKDQNLSGELESRPYRRAVNARERVIKNHKAQIEALDRGVELLNDPSPHVHRIIDKAYEVSAKQEKIKAELLGYDPEILASHGSEVASIVRGEKIAMDENGRPMGVVKPGSIEDNLLTNSVKMAENDLNREKRKLVTLEKKLVAPSKKAGVIADRPGIRAKIERQREAVDAATDRLLVSHHHREVLGSRVSPLNIYEREGELADAGVEDPAIADLRQGRGTGFISTRARASEADLGLAQRMMTRISRSKYGARKPRVTVYRMTGASLQMGDNLIDMSDLLVNELQKAVKGGMEMDRWNKIWASAMSTEDFNRHVPDPLAAEGTYMQPVRDIRSVPTHLKKYADALFQSKMDRKKIEQLDQEGYQALREWMYPKKEDILKEGDPHIRWFDERFFMDTIDKGYWQKVDRLMSNAMAPINAPFRTLLIFGTPAYLLNAVGAAGLLITKRGFLAIPHLGRAFASSRIYGGEVSRLLDVLAGGTHTGSLVGEKNVFTKFDQTLAASWQVLTDQYFRRAAVIARLRDAGFMKDHLSPDDLLAELQAPENRIAVRQAAQLGRSDMLDFDKMTWPEKATLRHLVFVYAFMRAGSIYSVRWLLEHPVQADVIAHVGEDRKKEIERLVGKTPSWFLRENYFPIGHDTVLNGVQLNVPDTLNQLAYPIAALFAHIPYQSPLDILGPAASGALMTGTGVEPGGKSVPNRTGVPIANSLLEMFAQTPAGFWMRDRKTNVPRVPAPISSGKYDPVEAARTQEVADLKQPTQNNDTLWNGWGEVIFRSALPRHPNQAGLAARYWRDLKGTNLEAWKQHQIDLVHQLVQRQAKALGTQAPQEVLNAVDIVANREAYVADQMLKWQKVHQQKIDHVGDRQLAAWTIDFLKKEALITPATAKRYHSDLNQITDPREAKKLWIGALRDHGTKPWEQWVQKADEVNWFNEPQMGDALTALKESKLGDYTAASSAPENAKWAYGRKYVNYLDRLHQFDEQARRAGRNTERTVIATDKRDYIARNDKDVILNGHTFPSPVRMAYARLAPDAKDNKIKAAANAGWKSLDGFTKELLTGDKPSPDVSFGYRNLAAWLDAYKKDNPGKTAPNWLKAGYVKSLEKQLPAFKADYEFSRRPLAARLQHFTVIEKSTYSDEWSKLLKLAADRSTSMKKGGYTETQIADQWRVYDLPEIQKWIGGLPVGFRREIARWQAGHPHFLDSLVR